MKKEAILAHCLEEISSGKSTIEECTGRFPEYGKELRSLLEIATCIKPEKVTPSPEFKQRTRARLIEEMQPGPASVPFVLWHRPGLTLVRVIASTLVIILILGVAGSSTVYAAQSSLPGDILYPVKTGVENIQLTLAADASAKADIHLTLAQKRIDEAAQEIKLSREVNAQALSTIGNELDEAIKEISTSCDAVESDATLSRLSISTLNQQLELEQVLVSVPDSGKPAIEKALETTRRGNLIARTAYANHDLLEHQPSVSDEELETGEFKVDGILSSIQGTTWNVGGVVLQNVHNPGTAPIIGNRVKVEGLVKDNAVFLRQIEETEASQKTVGTPTKVEGQFRGNNQDGTSIVGGIPLTITDNESSQLQIGDTVQLQSDNVPSQSDNVPPQSDNVPPQSDNVTPRSDKVPPQSDNVTPRSDKVPPQSDNTQARNGKEETKLKVTNKESAENEAKMGTRLSGTLTGVNAADSTVTIRTEGNQIIIDIKDAQIENGNGNKMSLADLNRFIGKKIQIDGLSKKDNTISASRLRLEEEQEKESKQGRD